MARKITYSVEESLQDAIPKMLSNLLYERGITQREFANRMGVSAPTVSAWCSGTKTPRLENIDKMCEILDVSRSYLLGTGYIKPTKENASPKYDSQAEEIEAQMQKMTTAPITLQDILLAQSLSKLNDQQKRMLKYMLAFFENENNR